MTHRTSGIVCGREGRGHRHIATRTTGLVLAAFALSVLSIPTAAGTELAWRELWNDDFDHSMNPDWVLQTYGDGDLIEVVPEGFEVEDRNPPRAPVNSVLYGRSLDRRAGHGFAARTPSWAELGIDETAAAWRIDFRYMVVGEDFCWTLPLASPDLTLVISDCSADGHWARLGIVDDQFRHFRPIASIEVRQWHSFSIRIRRLSDRATREVSVFLDDTLIERHQSRQTNSYQGLVFMDLPALPVDLTAPEGLPDAVPHYFGSGYWDDVRIEALQPLRRPGAKKVRDVRLEPNPFNPATALRMDLATAGSLDVVVYDMRGRLVRTLHAGAHPAGPVELRWDGRDLRGREVASGVYLVRVRAPEVSRVVRAVLVR